MSLFGYAQGSFLTKAANLMRDSDALSILPISYFFSEAYGKDAVWDFSDFREAQQKHSIWLQKDSLGRNIMITNRGITNYCLSGDSLFISGEEAPLSKIEYERPILSMHYPFSYGDSISAPFNGYGIYCGDHLFLEQGVSTIKADAEGRIVIGEDTISNVLRVYSLKSYSICMDIDSAALDTARLKQVIEERYDWYARGYRYPLFTTVTSTSYDNATPLGTTQTAWCMLPDIQRLLADSCNEGIRRNDSIALAEKAKSTEEIIHYSIAQNGNLLTVGYSLDSDADITALVSDVMGVVYKQCRQHNGKGDGYTLNMDCNGLRHGKYILYINVNGKVYNEKVTLK